MMMMMTTTTTTTNVYLFMTNNRISQSSFQIFRTFTTSSTTMERGEYITLRLYGRESALRNNADHSAEDAA